MARTLPLSSALCALLGLGLLNGCEEPPAGDPCTVATVERDCGRGQSCGPTGLCDRAAPLFASALLPSGAASEGPRDALALVEALASGGLSGGGTKLLDRGLTFDVEATGDALGGAQALLGRHGLALVGPLELSAHAAIEPLVTAAQWLQVAPLREAPYRVDGEPAAPAERQRFAFTAPLRGVLPGLVDFVVDDIAAKPGNAPTRAECRNVALVVTDDADGQAATEAATELLRKNCQQLTTKLVLPAAQPNDAALDAVVAPFYSPGSAESRSGCLLHTEPRGHFTGLLRAFERRGPPPGLRFQLATSPHFTPALLDELKGRSGRPSLGLGLYGVVADPAPEQRPQYQALLQLEASRRGGGAVTSLPQGFTETFDAAAALALAMELAGPQPTPAKLRDALLEVVQSSPGDAQFGPGQFAEALAQARKARLAGWSSGTAGIDWVGALDDLELGQGGTTARSALIWRVEGDGTTEGARFARVRSSSPAQLQRVERDPGYGCRL